MHSSDRRRFLVSTGIVLAGLTAPRFALATVSSPRVLSFRHLHTGETLHVDYDGIQGPSPDVLSQLHHLMRDFRTDEVHPIDPKLLDILSAIQAKTETSKPFEIISAYRSPKTNAMLRSKSNGVAKRSLHMQGRAIDIRLPGIDTKHLRALAVDLKVGGVGYYGKSNFVHLDTGRFRTW
jgi:uncharacterized protein YcbK (DUF882 family)